jgi:exopolysaccharide biosynthesis polyprenyl glycosylphosphotransferase
VTRSNEMTGGHTLGTVIPSRRIGRGSIFQRALVPVSDVAAGVIAAALTAAHRSPAAAAAIALAVLVTSTTVRGPVFAIQPHLLDRLARIGGSVAAIALVGGFLVPTRATEIVTAAVAAVVALGASRTLLTVLVRRQRRRGVGLEPALIVGAGHVGQAVAQSLATSPEHGVRPLGYVDSVAEPPTDMPVLGTPAELGQLIGDTGSTTVVLAFGPVRDPELVEHLRRATVRHRRVRILALPRFYELGTARGGEINDLAGYPLIEISPPPQHRPLWWAKRTFDTLFAGALLVLTAPILAVIALAVRMSSPGPVIFRQERIGLDGQPFELMKFRTMRQNLDSDVKWSVESDPRVTRVGRFLRDSHLDELPQLVNVIRGEMALVGPRPERPHFVEQFAGDIRGYEHRLRVPVGMTGLAQVHGLTGDTSIEERARFDNRYIEDWTLLGDLRILGRTVAMLADHTTPAVEAASHVADNGRAAPGPATSKPAEATST